MANLKFDEIVDGSDLLGAFESNKENKSEVMPSFDEVDSNVVESSEVVKEQVNMTNNTVTISSDQFSELLNMVKGLTAEVATLKAGKPNKVKAEKKATADKPKRTKAEYMAELKDKAKVVAAERLAKCIAESGKSQAEVKAAFKIAHTHGSVDQTAYKARYDEKLFELIGVKKYAVAV